MEVVDVTRPSETPQGSTFYRSDTVHFDPIVRIYTVPLVDESRDGRIWRQSAMDRSRFRLRIERTGEILDKVLQNKLLAIREVT